MNKTPADIYEEIKLQTPPNIDELVLTLVKKYTGKKTIERKTLIEKVYGIKLPPEYDLTNSREDRQIRRCLKRLSKTHAIIGISSRKGYSYAKDATPIYALIEENRRKAMSLLERNSVLEKIAEREFGGLVPLPGMQNIE